MLIVVEGDGRVTVCLVKNGNTTLEAAVAVTTCNRTGASIGGLTLHAPHTHTQHTQAHILIHTRYVYTSSIHMYVRTYCMHVLESAPC